MLTYRYRFLRRPPVALVRLVGPFDLERSLQTLDAIERHPRRGEASGLMWDAGRRSSYPVSGDVRRLIHAFHRWDRVGVVAESEASYGMARMASLLSDRVEAFRTRERALDWLRGGSQND